MSVGVADGQGAVPLADLEVPVDETRCNWPACRHGDGPTAVLVTAPDGWPGVDAGTWCLCHLGDDCLPRLRRGPAGQCARCSENAYEQTERGVHLHAACRRIWAMAQDARPARGAYARRRG